MEHKPVLLKEAIESLNINPDGVYVDGTLGGASHAETILKRLNNGRLYGFDIDDDALSRARRTLAAFEEKHTLIKGNFRDMQTLLAERGVHRVDGILLDLGVSSFHFDDASRGFSYRFDAPLDMRMDPSAGTTAREIVNTYSQKALKKILYDYGEERFAPLIAKNIVKRRKERPIETTGELVEVIKSSIPRKKLHGGGHPAKRTFQALRIEVNDELNALAEGVQSGLELLKRGGRFVIISFHSLEDRIVKRAFRAASTVYHPEELPTMPTETPDFHLINRKIIRPGEEEMRDNPRAKSAKMRAIERVKG